MNIYNRLKDGFTLHKKKGVGDLSTIFSKA